MSYSLLEQPTLDSPVMISALNGWVDAAGAGTGAAAELAEGGDVVATFDGDLLFDYRSQRPILDIVDGVMKRTVWPEVKLQHSQHGGRDLLVLSGHEPDFAWHRFSDDVLDLARKFGVAQLITLGSVPAAVPHTLPAPVMTTASDADLLHGDVRPPEGLLRVPAAAVSMIDQHLAENGIPTVGFFVQVPHYVTGSYPSGVIALLRRLAAHLAIDISTDELEREETAHRQRLDSLIADQPEAQEHVRSLEAMNTEQRAVSGEELASEIERYLRDAAPRDRRQDGEGNEGPQ
jgi:proteasome assembly chaperone (PAC2) family protein